MAPIRIRTLPALAALAVAATLAGCGGTSSPDCSPASTKGAILATARSWYLFDSLIPTTGLDPSDPTLSPAEFLDAITAEARSQGKDRHFSYLSTKEASAQFFEEGTSLGFGIGLRFVGTDRLFVAQVFGDTPGDPSPSPAALAGLARGDELLAIAPTQAALADPDRQVAAILAADALTPGALGAAFSSSVLGTTRWFRLLRPDGSTAERSATTAVYSLDPVPGAAAPTILDSGGRKVGYLALRTFVGPAVPLLRQAFATFQAQGVSDLIVDLRYDGGGRLDVASVFLDLLRAGHAGDQKFWLLHNAQHPEQNAADPFRAEPNAIAPARVAFIVTQGSASASELLPFALLPYLGADVALVGERTYGKPVGQYGFAGQDCPTLLYLLGFQLANRDAAAAYFTGLPDTAFAAAGSSCAAEDDLTHATRDPLEASTAAALQWIVDGSCAGGAIPTTDAPVPLLSRRVVGAAFPGVAEPSLAQRHLPGLF